MPLLGRRSAVAAGNSNQSGNGWGAGGVIGALSLTVSRQDGGSGNTLVNTGIFLAQGELMPASVSGAGVWSNGVELTTYVEALKGQHQTPYKLKNEK